MKVKLSWVLEIRDQDGKLVKRRRGRGHSYVLAMMDILYVQMSTTSQTIMDTGGTNRSVGYHAYAFQLAAGAGAGTWGPVVGTGTTAVTIADYKLAAQIAHGTGSGQLSYQATTFTTPSTSGSMRRFYVHRNFLNQSGATITIYEVGLYACAASTPYIFCIARDLINGGQAVQNNYTATLTYRISVSA